MYRKIVTRWPQPSSIHAHNNYLFSCINIEIGMTCTNPCAFMLRENAMRTGIPLPKKIITTINEWYNQNNDKWVGVKDLTRPTISRFRREGEQNCRGGHEEGQQKSLGFGFGNGMEWNGMRCMRKRRENEFLNKNK